MTATSLATALADLPVSRASSLLSEAPPLLAGAEVEAGHHPVTEGLRGLLGTGLRRGASYLVEGSTSLCLAMAAGVSQEGGWCAAVGMPRLGMQAAAGLGIDLQRFAVVPDPGSHWLEVVATLADAVEVILLAPEAPVRDADLRRLAARLRQHGSTLIVHGRRWSGIEARFTVTDSHWAGAHTDGRGYLSARHALVTLSGKGAPVTERLWLPGPDGGVRPVDESPERVLRAVR
ncbi:hypothetical protein [Blastococcus sp. Marseille-P5729]|uniref:hypothetical protein n=1 Tax=Blastococcus sp. Marseille-P5729 TaxID=2086582 RepID=UPI000D0EA27B|nr:hypothetical protein [Blastococcus sp. Marseille-P5729]